MSRLLTNYIINKLAAVALNRIPFPLQNVWTTTRCPLSRRPRTARTRRPPWCLWLVRKSRWCICFRFGNRSSSAGLCRPRRWTWTCRRNSLWCPVKIVIKRRQLWICVTSSVYPPPYSIWTINIFFFTNYAIHV